MVTITVTVRTQIPVANGGGFPEASFDHLLQREVTQPGLDAHWRQVLINAEIVEGGDAAVFTLHCEPREGALIAERSLRIHPGTPPAYVRLLAEDDSELHAGPHAAPLYPGQPVAIGERHYEVVSSEWPGRDPDTGVCAGDIDWQRAIVREIPRPSWLPTLAD